MLVNIHYFTLAVTLMVRSQYFEEHSFQNISGINFILDKYLALFLSFLGLYFRFYFALCIHFLRNILFNPNNSTVLDVLIVN